MKLLLLTAVLFTLTKSDECPAKLLKVASKEMKTYFKGFYSKVEKMKIKCTYEHDGNIFNLEHHIKAKAEFKKRRLNFEVKTHSSMFNLFDFSDFDGKICHNKVGGEKKEKDLKLIKESFLKKFAKNITDHDIRRTDKNGAVCYTAKISRKKRSLI